MGDGPKVILVCEVSAALRIIVIDRERDFISPAILRTLLVCLGALSAKSLGMWRSFPKGRKFVVRMVIRCSTASHLRLMISAHHATYNHGVDALLKHVNYG